MFKVNYGKEIEGKITYYEIQDQETKATAHVRPSQLQDFCILRNFENAKYENMVLKPFGDGFGIERKYTSIESRQEQLHDFVEKVASSKITVIGYKPNPTVGCSPTEFYISMDGVVGKIYIYPGTEYFNRHILNSLDFDNVVDRHCTTIHGTHGYSIPYIGWNFSKMTAISKDLDYKFYIRSKRHEPNNWKNDYPDVDFYSVQYEVTVKGDINGTAYISENNDILGISLRRSDEK
jgi:hypothetical protein